MQVIVVLLANAATLSRDRPETLNIIYIDAGLIIVLLLTCNSSIAEERSYKLYANEKLGVSFEYPAWAEVEDISQRGTHKIWFHIGEWPKNVAYVGEKPPRSPVSGVLFEVKSTHNFKEFVNQERSDHIKGGYKNEISEKEYAMGSNVVGIEFVRVAKVINKIMHYFIFPSLKENVTLSLWHLQGTSTGPMGNPEEEAKALIEYEHMKNTLKVFK